MSVFHLTAPPGGTCVEPTRHYSPPFEESQTAVVAHHNGRCHVCLIWWHKAMSQNMTQLLSVSLSPMLMLASNLMTRSWAVDHAVSQTRRSGCLCHYQSRWCNNWCSRVGDTPAVLVTMTPETDKASWSRMITSFWTCGRGKGDVAWESGWSQRPGERSCSGYSGEIHKNTR